jgi:hypothetical protein
MTFRGPSDAGLTVGPGDQVVVPPGALSFGLDPASSSGQFTKPGLAWFVQTALNDFGPDAGDLRPTLEAFSEFAMKTLEESALLGEIDFGSTGAGERVWDAVRERPDTAERWAWLMLQGSAMALQALEDGDAGRAALGAYHAVNGRTLLLYVQQLDEVLWRGYRAEGLRHLQRVLATWQTNRKNDDELFWQATLLGDSVLLTQLFAAPTVVHADQAYVGGKRMTNVGGQVTDFMVRNELLGSVALIEIKSPVTALLTAREYRAAVFASSSELSGSVAQVLKQRDQLLKSYYTLVGGRDEGWVPWDPRAFVIAGDSEQLDTPDRRSSFELFRRSLKDVTIVTFDELFAKAEKLVSLLADSASAGA